MNATMGAIRIEFTRISRQRGLWLALGPAYTLIVLPSVTSPGLNRSHGPARVADWAILVTMLSGLVLAPAFADVFSDQRSGLVEVLRATPSPVHTWLGARIIGALAVVLPVLAILLGVGVHATVTTGRWAAIPAAVAAFLLIVVPGTLVVLGLSALLGALLPTAFARIAALLVWAWAAFFDTPTLPGPSLGGTVASPAGFGVAIALFGSTVSHRHPGPGFAFANVAVLLLIGLASTLLASRATARLR